MIMKRLTSLIILMVCSVMLFTACGKESPKPIKDIITNAQSVKINGDTVDTVEASMGAFQGKQGDSIEFIFSEEQTFNTVFINEKTTAVRQYNIYALVNGKYKLIHTGKHITIENITIEPITTTAVKLVIVNTEIGNDNFTIQGVSLYNTEN